MHYQCTSNGKWIVFASARVKNEAMAVNAETGKIVQVTEGGYSRMLNVKRKSMKLYFMRKKKSEAWKNELEIIEVDLEKLRA